MLETDSDNYYDSFDKIIPMLKSLKGKLIDPSVIRKPSRIRVWHLLTGLLFLNLAALSIYLYFNPELAVDLRNIFQQWLK